MFASSRRFAKPATRAAIAFSEQKMLTQFTRRAFSETAMNSLSKSGIKAYGAAAAAAVVACGAVALNLNGQATEAKPSLSKSSESNSKLISLDSMEKMIEEEGRIVVAHQGSVYDVTEFTGHPGGYGRLEMAAGGDLEVYWSVYTQHNRGHVSEWVMAPYKIGEVTERDMRIITDRTHYDDTAFRGNPEPYPNLLTNTRYPYNAEARLSSLTDSFITPIGNHFVRNHSAVPDIDPEEYRLTVNGEGIKETIFTLEDLKTKFPKVEVTTVIQCNGNRREDFHYIDGETPAFGPPHWVAGAMGCATWSGVRMRDLLRASGMDVDSISLGKIEAPEKATEIGLLAYDHDEVGNQYCCSFPFDKAIDPFGDVIVAYEMNGQPIPRSHGYPVRSIVPGE
jgi:sulfite oxidase